MSIDYHIWFLLLYNINQLFKLINILCYNKRNLLYTI
jgi:hypothetical protein